MKYKERTLIITDEIFNDRDRLSMNYHWMINANIVIVLHKTDTFTVVKNRFGQDNITYSMEWFYKFLEHPEGHTAHKLDWVYPENK